MSQAQRRGAPPMGVGARMQEPGKIGLTREEERLQVNTSTLRGRAGPCHYKRLLGTSAMSAGKKAGVSYV
eukprot:1139015-Pelagomonas_calceolata.AAC.8